MLWCPSDVSISQSAETGSASTSTAGHATSASRAPRQLWIRFHPISHAEVWGALRSAVTSTLIEIRDEQAAAQVQNGKGKGKARESDVAAEVQIEMSDRREEVNAFEIMGPKSARVLKGALGGLVRDERRLEMRQVSSVGPRFRAD